MASSTSVPGGSAAAETIGPLSPFQKITGIHFPASGTVSSTLTVTFDGAAQYLFGEGEPTANVYLMHGPDIFHPTAQILMGVAQGFEIQIPMSAALLEIPATDNVWIGQIGLDFELPQEFDGTFVCKLITETTINHKVKPTKTQLFQFTTPEGLPGFTPGMDGSIVSLGWLANGGSGGPLSNTATFPGARVFDEGASPSYAVWPLVFDFVAKQVSTTVGTVYDVDRLVAPPAPIIE